MMSEHEFAAIEARVAAATGDSWGPGLDEAGMPVVCVHLRDGAEEVLRVTRDRAPAGEDDVHFVAHARIDLQHLIASLGGAAPLPDEELDRIEARSARASPAPWTVFLEEDGGTAGCNVIWVSGNDDEPDLYLWLGPDLAPSADFEFVAAARQDIPSLLAEVRRIGAG